MLLEQQRVIFDGWQAWRAGKRITARRWGQAVWLDMQVRDQLPQQSGGTAPSGEMLYQEYLKFGEALGLPIKQLPGSLIAFNGWAGANFFSWEANSCYQLALGCVTELVPLCWPVNIAVILYLLPAEFWGIYGRALGKESARLAAKVEWVFTDLSFSNL